MRHFPDASSVPGCRKRRSQWMPRPSVRSARRASANGQSPSVAVITPHARATVAAVSAFLLRYADMRWLLRRYVSMRAIKRHDARPFTMITVLLIAYWQRRHAT